MPMSRSLFAYKHYHESNLFANTKFQILLSRISVLSTYFFLFLGSKQPVDLKFDCIGTGKLGNSEAWTRQWPEERDCILNLDF